MKHETIRMMKKRVLFCIIFLGIVVSLVPMEAFAVGNPYPSGQCTHYVWQYVYDNLGIELPQWHNAKDWPANAAKSGDYTIGYTPVVNSIAVWEGDSNGHVGIITSVDGDSFTYNEGGTSNRRANEYGIYEGHVWPDGYTDPPSCFIYIGNYDANHPAPSTSASPVLPDGDYIIAAMADPHYYLDIEGAKSPADAGSNVHLWYSSDGKIDDYDAWTVRYSNGYYRISQLGQNLSLDVYNELTANGANVQVWTNNDSSAQKWTIIGNSSVGYRLKAQCSNKSLEYQNSVLASGTNVQQWADDDVPAQYWVFIPYSHLDVNGWLDGKESNSIGQHGTFDVYINGKLDARGVNDYYTAWPSGTRYEIKNISAASASAYKGVHSGSLSGTIGSSTVEVWLSFSTKPHSHLDVNGWLDGKESNSIGQHGTFDVYINGKLDARGVNDYYTAWPSGTRYEIKNISAASTSAYKGVHSGSLSGTIGSSTVEVWLSFSTKPTVTSPKASFEPWIDDRYTYIEETDASIGQRIVVTDGVCTEVGMILYDAYGNELGSGKNPTYEHEKNYFKINEELGITLRGGTVYQYKFYAIVNGQTMYGSMGSFTTNPSSHSHSYSRTVVHEPTCADSGYAIDECAVCGLRQEVDLPALGHDYADGVCRRCGAVNPGHSHEYSWSITQQPTCTEAGYETGICACGVTTTRELPVLEHDFVNGICSRCGAVSSEHSHVFIWTTTKQATCTEKGSETGVCACGNTFLREIAPLGHDYLNGACTRCGAAEPSSATIRINVVPAPAGPIVGGAGSTISADPALSNINIDLSKLP